MGRPAEDLEAAGGKGQEPENGLEKSRLADAVGAEHCDVLTRLDADAHPAPYRSAATVYGCILEAQRRRPDGGRLIEGRGLHDPYFALASASRSACSCFDCQSWKVRFAGSRVSVTDGTGMPLALALSPSACTSGVEFWLLKTRTLICLFAI